MSSRHAQAVNARVAQGRTLLVDVLLPITREENPDAHAEAEAFVDSQFQRHRFLEPNSHAVTRKYNGLIEKLTIHSLPLKAERLQSLLQHLFHLKLPVRTCFMEQARFAPFTAAVVSRADGALCNCLSLSCPMLPLGQHLREFWWRSPHSPPSRAMPHRTGEQRLRQW